MADAEVRIVSQYTFVVLEKPLTLPTGEVLPAGTKVMFAPQTTAHSVRVPGAKSLLEAWDDLSKTGHEHSDLQATLATYQAELARMADRLTKQELLTAQNGHAQSAAEDEQENP